MTRENLEVHIFRNAAELVDAINSAKTRKGQMTTVVDDLDRLTLYREVLSDGSEVFGFELGKTTAAQWKRELE